MATDTLHQGKERVASTAADALALGTAAVSPTPADCVGGIYGGPARIRSVAVRGVVSKTADYTLTDDDYVALVNTTSGNVVITLPAVASRAGWTYHVKRLDGSANTLTLIGNVAGETIDGSVSITIPAQYQCVTVYCDGAVWHIL